MAHCIYCLECCRRKLSLNFIYILDRSACQFYKLSVSLTVQKSNTVPLMHAFVKQFVIFTKNPVISNMRYSVGRGILQ